MKNKRRDTILWLLTVIFCLTGGAAFAENIDPLADGSKHAYGENTGWLNFQPTFGPGVTVNNATVTGFAWGENIGWINLSPMFGGVANDGAGTLSGFAWAENAGWINFAPTGGGVSINPATGEFSGDAWGENVGWIRFRSTGAIPYGVTTAWRGLLPPLPGDLDLDGDVDRTDIHILLQARNQPAQGANDPRDLDGDGMITGRDARKIVLLCTRPRCATS